jgi:uncharacterized protein (DUF608 family)
MAGPFTEDDFAQLVPADKKLSEDWVRSLYERGEPEWFAGEELHHIGMAIGGICCGHVYLGGDGRLWHWDIFNQSIRTGSEHYRSPMEVRSAVDLGFAIRTEVEGQVQTRTLDGQGFGDVRFRGAYPLGRVEYADKESPVAVSLQAFSPFAPLDVDRSSLPLTVMRYTVRNTSQQAVACRLAGGLTNPVLLDTGSPGEAELVNTIHRGKGATSVLCTAEPVAEAEPQAPRPDIVFDDFESEKYENWSVEGTAFGEGPITASRMPAYQGDVGAHGKKLVNSHNTRQGEDVRGGDAHTGAMLSKPFAIQRRYVNFLIGGGANQGQTCMNLLVDGKAVASASGQNHNQLRPGSFDVRGLEGQTARLQIVDQVSGGWGNIGVDRIVFSDRPARPSGPVDERPDFGDMTLAVLDDSEAVLVSAGIGDDPQAGVAHPLDTARGPIGAGPKGTVGKSFTLSPGEETTISIAVAWRFANVKLPPVGSGHYYAERFSSSLAAVEFLAERYDELYRQTKLWHDTWYDSTLPYWLLDRTFVNVSTLATGTCLRVGGGRFWGWEGVRCCAGTCSHVWHYAQAAGRVFPELERITRENVDYGLAFHEDGRIDYRGEFGTREAIDGQCGTILRVLREHQMSPDDAFLRRIWPRVRQSIEYLIAQDGDSNGVLEGAQYNTLDAAWYGPISWISSLYLAALRAGAAMAGELGDPAFADRCGAIADRGARQIVEQLFNGEYFYQRRDPEHPEAFGAGIGCHIDQVFGQGWAHQVGLPRVLPKEQTVTALESLWRYNFTPDVGPYRERYPTGRWYAMPGEAGLIMCTFPKGGEREARGDKPTHGFAGYFNECMNGFEYQAAGHMIAEGLVEEGLAVGRAIHDRYHASRRNPYNEIECGDHYARSMASFGVYVSVCGFQHHGPQGQIGFAPKVSPANFKAAFVAAEGWGTFQQALEDHQHTARLQVRFGRVRLRTISLAVGPGALPEKVRVTLGDQPLAATLDIDSQKALVQLAGDTVVGTEDDLVIELILQR